MREVESRARTAGGRVWALIRGQSRQQSGDDEVDDDDDEDSGDGGDAGVNGVGAGAGAGGGGTAGTSSRTTAHDGDISSNSNGNSNGNDAAAPEWVLSRLELMRMRRRGSFLDGDELGPVRTTAAGVGHAPAGTAMEGTVATGGGGGEVVTAECFGNLARLAAAEGNEDRRDTDEAVAVLREAMEQHSAALARLAGWMFQTAAPANGGGNGGSGSSIGAFLEAAPPAGNQAAAAAAAATPRKGVEARRGSLSSTHSPPPPPPLSSLDLTGDVGESYSGVSAGEEGVRAMLELSRESDVLEGRVKRERFRAHRAADEEIHRTPGLYKDACALGNALILKGHDYLSQVYMNYPAVAQINTRSYVFHWSLRTRYFDGRRGGKFCIVKWTIVLGENKSGGRFSICFGRAYRSPPRSFS